MAEQIYIYKRFERFWHWSQAALIIFMLFTGLGMRGWHGALSFEYAYGYHVIAAWTLVGLWCIAIFWHFATGEWKQYLPSTKNVMAMVNYYMYGIFKNAPHPHKQTALAKHNPLQKLAYLFILVIVGPVIWTSGWLMLFYDVWADWGVVTLGLVSLTHVIAAYAMLLFLIAHVYLTTTGATPLAHLRAMITGYEKVH